MAIAFLSIIAVTFSTEMKSVILAAIEYWIQVTEYEAYKLQKCKSKIGNYWKYYGKEKYTTTHFEAICKNKFKENKLLSR
jgi:hypothetical protein